MVRQELAAIARRAENDFVGVPTGIMDQSAALLCQAGHALLLDCRSGEADSVPLDPALSGLALVIIDTRARHALTESGYGARHIECEEAARALGVRTLREVPGTDSLAALADPVLRRRARHVITENQRVLEAAALLRRGKVAGIGPLLNQSHASLRDDFEISWPEADVAVDAAIGGRGAGRPDDGRRFRRLRHRPAPRGRQGGARGGLRRVPRPGLAGTGVPGRAAVLQCPEGPDD